MIKEVVAKSILTKHEHEFPTLWDANPYRGCTIGCKYCFAQYSHQYLGLENFFKDIIVKINVAEQLHKDFCKKSWQYDQIKLGGITDIYQHAESKYELLPKVIDVLKKHRNPVFIQTKSTLILRDFELIKELANYTTVDIATSISTFDESYRMKIEPGAASAHERMEMLRKFNEVCRTTTVAFMPVIPLISDTDENLETAFKLTSEYELDHIIAYPLHLRGKLRVDFFGFLKNHFPELSEPYEALYRSSNLNEKYADTMFRKIAHLRQKYQLWGQYSTVPKQELQLSLF